MGKRSENLTRIISRIQQEPNGMWTRTQRELATELGLSQSELSLGMKQLRNEGKVVLGQKLPYRGKNYEIVLSTTKPFRLDEEAIVLRNRRDLEERIKQLRDELTIQHQLKMRILSDKDRLETEVQSKDEELTELRSLYNQLLLDSKKTAQHTVKPIRGYKVSEIARQDSDQILHFLKTGG